MKARVIQVRVVEKPILQADGLLDARMNATVEVLPTIFRRLKGSLVGDRLRNEFKSTSTPLGNRMKAQQQNSGEHLLLMELLQMGPRGWS